MQFLSSISAVCRRYLGKNQRNWNQNKPWHTLALEASSLYTCYFTVVPLVGSFSLVTELKTGDCYNLLAYWWTVLTKHRLTHDSLMCCELICFFAALNWTDSHKGFTVTLSVWSPFGKVLEWPWSLVSAEQFPEHARGCKEGISIFWSGQEIWAPSSHNSVTEVGAMLSAVPLLSLRFVHILTSGEIISCYITDECAHVIWIS